MKDCEYVTKWGIQVFTTHLIAAWPFRVLHELFAGSPQDPVSSVVAADHQ